MEIIETGFQGVYILKPQIFHDDRGYFFESYNKKKLGGAIPYEFVQDNQAFSQKNTLRGLHFQNPPHAQAKLVSVIQGSVLDVIVDIRKASPTFGKHLKIQLDGKEKNMLMIPEGFAHGYLTLEDNTMFFYKCSGFYNKPSEGSIIWNDPVLNIDWGTGNPVLSEKDRIAPAFKELNLFF